MLHYCCMHQAAIQQNLVRRVHAFMCFYSKNESYFASTYYSKTVTHGTAAQPPLPFCSIWDLTAIVSTCVFCTVAGTGVYATLLLHAPRCNTSEFGSMNPWVHVFLGTQKVNCKRAITGTAAAPPPLPFCSIWDLTAIISMRVFCTVAGTGVYATLLLLHAPSCNTTEPGLANPWVHAKIQQTKMLVTCQRFGDLFSFGLVWQYSSVQKKCDKGRFKVMTVVT